MKFGSVMTSLMDNGLGLASPLRLIIGISDPELGVNLPQGIDSEYLLFADKSTGGSPSEFIISFISLFLISYYCLYQVIQFRMGFFKILAFIAVPVSGMTYAAFSLGKQLPKATRKFGNYIGLSYVYFKTILKILKPEDQMPYQMIDIARKASQQSKALQRQLRNTIKKAKQDLHKKHQQTIANFEGLAKEKQIIIKNIEKTNDKQKEDVSGSESIRQILELRQNLKKNKQLKKQSRKFFQQI